MESQNLSSTEIKMQLLRDGIKEKEDSNSNAEFSIQITLPYEPNKKIVLVERSGGVEKFDALIEKAQNYNPATIIVTTFRIKTDKIGTKWNFTFAETKQEPEESLASQIKSAISKEMESFTESLNGLEGNGNLGEVQRVDNFIKLLEMKTAKTITAMQHDQTIADLNRQLADKHETISANESQITELEVENDKLSSEYEAYKTEKLSGLSEAMTKAGGTLLTNLASQYLPKLLGGNTPESPNLKGEMANLEESTDPRDVLVDQIRNIIRQYDDEAFRDFYHLMELITADKNNIKLTLKFLSPDNKGGE